MAVGKVLHSGNDTFKTGISVFYVDVSNDYHPKLQAKSAGSNGFAPSYVVGTTTYTDTQSTMINSDGQAKRIYFPPFESGLGKLDFGTTPQDPLNWHQFLAHLRFARFSYPSGGSPIDAVVLTTTIIYKLVGNRVLVDEYEHEVGNAEFGYDIPIGFDPGNLDQDVKYNFNYYFRPGYSQQHTNIPQPPYAMPQIIITSTNPNPWSLQFNDLNGLSLRFLTYATTLFIANGMIQTVEGVALDQNSDIVFERLIPDPNEKRWISVNDEYYKYTFGGLVYGDGNLSKYPWLSTMDTATVVSSYYADSYYAPKIFLDNMWISSSGYIGMYMYNSVTVNNSSFRADYTFSTFKNQSCKIEFSNSIVVARDDAFEDFAGNVSKTIKPYSIDGCVVCWKSAISCDQSQSYVSYWGVNQFNYKRGVFVNDVQEWPVENPPPASVFTSAVSELAVDVDRISYLNGDFSDITLSAGNLPAIQMSKILGISLKLGEFWYGSSLKSVNIDYAVNFTNSDIGKRYTPTDYYLCTDTGYEDRIYLYDWHILDYQFNNIWYKLTDVVSQYPIVRDGIGALYFPPFYPESFSISIESSEGNFGDPVAVAVGDGKATDFVNLYSPSLFDWSFYKRDDYYVEELKTIDNPVSVTVAEIGSYDVFGKVVSNKGFYSCTSPSLLSYRCGGQGTFDITVVDSDGSVPDVYYAGRPYSFSATNTSIVSSKTINKFYVEYGNNTIVGSDNMNSIGNSFINSDIGDFSTSGNSFVRPVLFNDVYGWTSFNALAFGYDGSYVLNSVKCFVGKKEDVYYVDLSQEYEDTKTVYHNTLFSDYFENDLLAVGWGTAFKNSFTLTNMWGDGVAVTQSPGYIKMFDYSLSNNFDIEFSLVRNSDTQIPVFKIVDSVGGFVTVYWNYINKTLTFNNNGTLLIVSLDGYPSRLDCSESLRYLSVRLFCVNGVVKVMYKLLDGDWSSETILNVLIGDIDLYIDAKPLVGIGYFKGTSDYGFGIVNGQDPEYALTFTEFRNRINVTSLLYDKYLCRGYRLVSKSQIIDVDKNITIDAWNSSSDPITYGPWILAFDDDKNTKPNFTNALLKNGVVYNTKSLGAIILGSVFDMFIVWSGVAKCVTQKYRHWNGSRYETSNLIGSTFNRIVK